MIEDPHGWKAPTSRAAPWAVVVVMSLAISVPWLLVLWAVGLISF